MQRRGAGGGRELRRSSLCLDIVMDGEKEALLSLICSNTCMVVARVSTAKYMSFEVQASAAHYILVTGRQQPL